MTERSVAGSADDTAAALVLLVDIGPDLAALYAEWLADTGLAVAQVAPGEPITAALAARVSAAVMELPYPRHGGAERLAERARPLAGRPVLALSPTFHAGIARHGPLARKLGVAAVVPAPVQRETLVGAVHDALRRGP